MTVLNHATLRAAYPALSRVENDQPVVWACAPGGTQVPNCVIEAMAQYQRSGVSNLHGPFPASAESDVVVDAARAAAACLLGAADPEQIHFGLNTTSLHFHLAHALAREWQAGDAIIVTSLDHDANVTPWVRAAASRGVEVRTWHFNRTDGQLHLHDLVALLDEQVRLVAVPGAANALGSIIDIQPISDAAHAVGAIVVVDAVHLAPHQLIDVRIMDCDAMTCSAYKVYGPHLGMQWLKPELAARLDVDKVRPSPTEGGARWEQGTVNLEALAGLTACVEHLCHLGGGNDRAALERAFAAITAHEFELTRAFFTGCDDLESLTIHGPTCNAARTPTFGCTIAGQDPNNIARALGKRGISTWSGHFYALGVIDRLGLANKGGLLRIGFAHYNTLEEVDRVVAALGDIIA